MSVLYIGPYSDRGGRKIPILMSSVGLMLNAAGTGKEIFIRAKRKYSKCINIVNLVKRSLFCDSFPFLFKIYEVLTIPNFYK